MSHPDLGSPRDLAAAYALGALGPEEAREFEAYLTTSPEAQQDVADYSEVAALLGLAQGEEAPGPGLRGRVLAKVAEDSMRRGPGRGRPPRLVWGALAASVLLAIGFGALALSLEGRIADRDAAIAERQAILDAVLEPGVKLFQLTASGDPEPAIQLFWNQRRNQALLNASRLKPVPAGRAYQLWFIQDGKPVPSVTFTPGSNGGATVGGVTVPTGGKISAAAVTVEPETGSQQPTSPIILSGAL